ncbi:putative cytochrome P450 [Aspergillus sclerotioniger CBS 115572]|uniref:Putative cytochrome P450 n=1 Tax=Aspergillus sclerotioniger CBS 115572 TaxID=1450535 RepID=A0A317VC99_9EURO|nr:putative cytochrome P450 [Aspergillus sclerotioniger CBS 115572]PWY70871.1 putative cytochrome P450 [Aspergillus sclerotioniger CBS 115572]
MDSKSGSLGAVITACGLALLAYSISLGFFRLFIHPLARFPGPRLAALTSWYELYWNVVKGGKFLWEIERLHQRYGPIVRINPDELHIADPDFYHEVYAPPWKKQDKERNYVQLGGQAGSALTTVDHDLHRLRASAIVPFFSKQAVENMEPLIKSKINRLCAYFDTCIGEGNVVIFSHAALALTVDVISSYAYGESYDCLERADLGSEFREILVSANEGYAILRHFHWLHAVMHWLHQWGCTTSPYIRWQKRIADQTVSVCKLHREGRLPAGTVFQAILDSNLPDAEKESWRLNIEAQTLLHAGSETSAKTLEIIMFYLLDDVVKLERLRAELKTVMPDPTSPVSWNQLQSLTYMSAVIQEGIRLQFGITTRSPRISHTALQYKDWIIPAGTPVSTLTWFVHTDETLFPRPFEFDPDRWIRAAQGGTRLDKYLTSFGKGSRRCLGINLAYCQITITLAMLIRRFQFRLFETTVEDVTPARDCFIAYAAKGRKGVRLRVVGRVDR